MTTQPGSFLWEISDDKQLIPEAKYAYFRERTRSAVFSLLIKRFLEKEAKGEMTRAHLARRLNKTKAQVSRWLSSSGNWELSTISDLALAIDGCRVNFTLQKIEMQKQTSRLLDTHRCVLRDDNVEFFKFSNKSSTERVRTTSDVSPSIDAFNPIDNHVV